MTDIPEYPPAAVWEAFCGCCETQGDDYALWEGDAGSFAYLWREMVRALHADGRPK